MATISYDPKNWHGSDTGANAPEEVRLRIATQTALDATEAALQAEIDVLDQSVGVVALTANGTARAFVAKPSARTISAIHARANVVPASTGGTVTLAIQDQGGTTLLSTATIDAEALTTAFVALTLTGTAADLAMAAGEAVQLVLVSNNGDATGGPVIVRITYT
jgi:hypothetical protein